jgi:hypothetical protein
LYKSNGLGDLLPEIASVIMHTVYNRVKNGGERSSAEAQAAWNAHGADDVYPMMRQVRQLCAELLPGARVTQHLLWRYSIIWTKQ